MAVQDYKINYKSDFVLNINGDAGWAIPFCIKFWTGMPSQAYFVGFDGVKYVNCRVGDTPTQLLVMFDDHHLPIGKLEMQIAYHTTIEEFPDSVFDEVTNARDVIVTIDGTDYQVLLDFTGEDAPELEFDLPAYANEAERIQNELQRQQNEADRIAAELQREQATAAAVQGAENVNAQLNGTTLTVTNRQGVSTSVNTKGEQGAQGPVGPEGPQGEQGETGISIVSFTPKSETSTTLIYTVTFSDGHTQDVAIPKGPKGDTGATGPQGQKGDTGVSITAFTYASETETDMIYTVTFSDSTTQQVSIPKGAKGDTGPQGPSGPTGPQGPMGDVAVITPEQQAAFTMYSTTGQNTDGPMTQKAVTDKLVAGSISYDNSQSGLAATDVQGALDEIGTVKAAVNINEESVQFISGQGIDGISGCVIADANAKRTDYIKIGKLTEGDTIVWGGTAKDKILAFYDYNYRLLTAYTATGTSRTITASAAAAALDVAYARITFSASGTPVFTINGKNILNQTSYELALDEDLDKHLPAEGIAVGERMRGVESVINDTMAITSDNPTLKNGYIIDINGEETAAKGWSCTDYIKIPTLNDGDTIYWGGISHNPSASLSFYDRFKHLITVYSAYLSPRTSTSRTIKLTNSSTVVINDAKYIRASFSGSPVLTLNGNTLFTKHQVVTDSTMTLDMPANARGVGEFVGSLTGVSIFKNGYFINTNGNEEESDTWCYARIDLGTPVQGGDVFVWNGITECLNAVIGFYGGNGSYIGGWSATGTSRTFTVSDSSTVIGATTIKASFLISSGNRSVSINGVNQDFSYIKEDKSVVDYNADKQPMVVSLSRTKVDDSTLKKYFCFAQITDTHGENVLVQRAVDFVNSEVFGSSIDCLVHTGDVQKISFTDGDMPAFHNAMDNSAKPAFTVIGNHDVWNRTSNADLYNRYIKPMVDKGLLVSGTNIDATNYATWYYYDFTEYSIRLIALNDFDPLWDGWTIGNSVMNMTVYSPAQIDFLISTLQSVPSGYTVIIVDHFPPNKGTGYSGTTINPDWTMGVSPIGGRHNSLFTGNLSPVIDILSAYKSKTSLVQSYTYSNSSVASHYGSVDVNVDFTSANGILAFMACGHSHDDEIYKFADKNDIIAIDMLGGVNPTIIDSPTKILRTYSGKAHDAINVYCVRTDERKVYVVRIGADFRADGNAQIMTSFEY